jgi:uncharacterized membrane protein
MRRATWFDEVAAVDEGWPLRGRYRRAWSGSEYRTTSAGLKPATSHGGGTTRLAGLGMQVRLNWRVLVLLLLMAFGVWLRISHLDRKVYWHDETHTSLRIFGYPLEQFIRETFTGELVTVDDLQKYQHPQSDKGLRDTLALLAQRPEHGPLYYLLAHFYAGEFQRPQVGARAVSAILSLLLIPLIYFLARELFDDRWSAGLAAALVAVSPLDLLYAQEAREYSLWAVTTAASSLALLRASRLGTFWAWRAYALTLILGLYSHLLFLPVVLVHGLYLLTRTDERRRVRLLAYARATLVATVVFAPWGYLLITQAAEVQQVTAWMGRHLALPDLGEAWVRHLGRLFFDFPAGDYWWVPASLLVVVSAYVVYRRASRDSRQFLALLTVVCAAVVIVPDLVAGGRRSAEARYLMPVWVGVQLSVGYALATASRAPRPGMRLVGHGLAAAVLLSGALSSLVISRSDTWWTKGVSYFNPEVARIINKSERPLVVSSNGEINPGEVLSLSYLLKPKVRLLLADYGQIPEIPAGFSDVFLFHPGGELREGLSGRYRLDPVHTGGHLWRLSTEPPGEGSAVPARAHNGAPSETGGCSS